MNTDSTRPRKFRFEKTDLGTTPPKISNIYVHPPTPSSRANQIIIDFDVQYEGDCDIQVSIHRACNLTFTLLLLKQRQVSILGVSSGVRDVQLTGRARLILRPTISSLPFIGGFQLCLLESPTIGFDMDGLANVCDWPGLRRKVRSDLQ